MCGLAGLWLSKELSVKQQISVSISQMAATLVQRGPDSSGFLSNCLLH